MYQNEGVDALFISLQIYSNRTKPLELRIVNVNNLTTYFVARMISETGANVHDVCDFSQNGTGSMKTVIHISDPVPPSHPR